MSNQEIRFRIVVDDAGIPAVTNRVDQGLQNMGDNAQRQGARMQVSAGQTAAAFRQLPAQLTDVATQLAGGQNPLLVLLQQGGQVKDSFGGIGPAAAALASMLSATGVASAGLAVSLGAVAFGAYQGREETVKLTKALALNGSAAGATLGQIDGMARSLAGMGVTGIGTAREALAGLAASGAFVGTSMEGAGRAVIALQRLSGQSTEEIVKDFASMRDGVAAWAAAHNRAYNYLTAAQYQQIRALEAQGRTQEAVRLNVHALSTTMESRAVPALGSLERAINSVKATGEGFWGWITDIGRTDALEKQLAGVTKALADFESGMPNVKVDSTRAAAIETERKRLRDLQASLQEQVRMTQRGTEQKAAANQKAEREILEMSAGFVSARLGLEASVQAKLLAEELRGSQARRIQVDEYYRANIISGKQYTEEIIADERRRIAAELKGARSAVDLAGRRVVEKPQDELARKQAVIAAETQLVNVLARRDSLEARVRAGAFKQVDQEIARDAFRRREIENLNVEDAAYAKWTADQRDQAIELAKATTEYTFALKEQGAAQALVNSRDLVGRRLSDGGRDQAGRMAAIADQYNADRSALDADLRTKRITQGAYDNRLALLRQYHEAALTQEQEYQDARARIESDSSVGFDRALANYLESSRNVATQIERLWTNAFSGMEDGLVRFATTGKFSFTDFANSVVADLIRITIRAQLSGLFSSLGSYFGGAGSASSVGAVNGSAGSSSVATFAAHGMAFDGMRAFASGGIVSRPTLFKFASGGAMRNGLMGEAGPEAIMPLRRSADGNLGVIASGGGGNTQVNIQVINQTGAPVLATTRQRSDGGIELLLTAAKQAVAGDIASGQGEISSALQGRYGLRPAMT